MASRSSVSKECPCQDPYADLPAELRPKMDRTRGGLRKVICPYCEQEYWTNRDRDECLDCEQKTG